jgi:hypothetical protein
LPRAQCGKLTNETDSSIGSGCRFNAKGAQQETDDTHADGGTGDTGEEQLSSAYMIHDC